MYTLTSFLSALTIAQIDSSPFLPCVQMYVKNFALNVFLIPTNYTSKTRILHEMRIHAKRSRTLWSFQNRDVTDQEFPSKVKVTSPSQRACARTVTTTKHWEYNTAHHIFCYHAWAFVTRTGIKGLVLNSYGTSTNAPCYTLCVLFWFIVLTSSTYFFQSRCQGCLFSLDHTQTHTTVSRARLDKESACRRDL
jgi:hypothetical protein